MTKDNMDRLTWLRKTLEDADLDVMREMLKVFAEELIGAEADALCGAGYGQRSDERVNRHNGYRERELDTRVSTIALAVPKLRGGTYYPDWLLENRRRAERALAIRVREGGRVVKVACSSPPPSTRKAGVRAWTWTRSPRSRALRGPRS